MTRNIDWLITGIIVALVLMAGYRSIFVDELGPFLLAVGPLLILVGCILHQHNPPFINAQCKRKPDR